MSISSILNIAKNALFAFQTSLQITSHNIANVSTKGYTRKEAVLTEATPIPTSIGLLGDGVRVKEIIRYYDKYLEDMISEKRTLLEEAKVKETYFSRIESLFNEENSSLSKAFTEFFNSFQELSLDPLSLSARMQVLLKGENLAFKIRSLYGGLKNLQLEVNKNIDLEVQEVTRILSSIAELNVKIFEGGITGSEAQDYMDQRTELIKELSSKLSIQSFEDKEGRVTILTENGTVLVDGGKYWSLDVDLDDKGFYKIIWKDPSLGEKEITNYISKGKIKALIFFRDSVIPDFIEELDGLAESLINNVNEIHKSGYNMLGENGLPFFNEIYSNFAKNIEVNPEIKADVRKIAHRSETEGEAGNEIALQIASLGTSTIPELSTSFIDYISNFSSKIGNLLNGAKDTLTFEEETMSILEKQRESVSGVSIDEEMTNLIRFQYAYQASAKLFTVADELLKSLLEAV